MVLQKARSRLHSHPDVNLTPVKSSFELPSKWGQSMPVSPKSILIWGKLQPWLSRWPQLIISGLVWFALWRLLVVYPPTSLAHILWPNSYLPVLGLWLIGSWYLGSFSLLDSRRGLLLAIIATAWLCARLQLIVTPWWFWALLVLSWATIEFTWRKLHKVRV